MISGGESVGKDGEPSCAKEVSGYLKDSVPPKIRGIIIQTIGPKVEIYHGYAYRDRRKLSDMVQILSVHILLSILRPATLKVPARFTR